VILRPLCSISMDSTLFADMSDVALHMCDVELRVFDVEQSVAHRCAQCSTAVSKILGNISWIQIRLVSQSIFVVLD
jgi:hypothetical protein